MTKETKICLWVFIFQKNIANFDYFHQAFSKTSYFISEECKYLELK